ncbi:MAG: MFS transporter [Oligoflexia bacterium]|nr:MFS transporter [Oligoflexia bacterium]
MKNSALKSPAVWAWALYDFANSSFGVLFLSLLFPVYFRHVIAGGGSAADFWWGLCSGGSVALAAVLSPFLGASLDLSRMHRAWLIAFSLLCISCTAALKLSPQIGFAAVVVLFVLANLGYYLSLMVYDTYLPTLTSRATRGTVSGFGWSLGYLGGLVASLAFSPWYRPGFDTSGAESDYLFCFVLIAVFFLVFALPAFFVLPQPGSDRSEVEKSGSSFRRVLVTLSHFSQHKQIFLLIVGYSLAYCALNTIFSFFSIYASVTLGASVPQVTIVFLIFQVVGLPAVFIAGKIGDKIGLHKVLLFSVLGWVVVVTALLLSPSLWMLYLLSAAAGCLSGPTSSSARALASQISPPDKSSEIMGFMGFAARIAAAVGPLVFGVMSWCTNSQQLALSFQLVFLISAWACLKACANEF